MNADLVTSLPISTLISFYNSENVDGVTITATYKTKVPYGILNIIKQGNYKVLKRNLSLKI